jgi:hypothetical protein
MPLFNAPAFLFLSILLAACAVASWPSGRLRPFLTTGLISIIPASWLVHLVTAGFTAAGALRFAPGWMQGDDGLWFWLWNFGIFLPLVAACTMTVFRPRGADTTTRVFCSVAIATLVFCFLFAVAPWAWDNTKLLLWAYLALAPFLWSTLVARWPCWVRTAACILLFASGALALLGGLDSRHGYKLADRAELAAVQFMLRTIPVSARLATAPSYEHPALILGQPVVMGHDGHLFSQGLDYGPAEAELAECGPPSGCAVFVLGPTRERTLASLDATMEGVRPGSGGYSAWRALPAHALPARGVKESFPTDGPHAWGLTAFAHGRIRWSSGPLPCSGQNRHNLP